ncbi:MULTISPECIES: G/U mismatch-specific DNA glycosylase [Acidobacteriaceae]|uniref:G/U mismatch-specific DNA glycosylase n=1 Tax=Acidobacteriaceae TaxID=204434 RepID=UPI00131E4082|nr:MULTISPECIES: G/U mismatch-specific DNA glycosylase [Acidobacteriaceae]MDW5267450.1 G/U mismatch-specific DNA glycosylase [Edaphobacter sp.]
MLKRKKSTIKDKQESFGSINGGHESSLLSPNPIQGLPDVLAKDLSVVFCGINPGMSSAAVGYHFASRSNRFWRTLHLSGFTPEQLLPQNATSLLDYGFGLTSAVDRPTIGANDLRRDDFINARPALERKVKRYGPRYLAFLGKPACSAIFNQREVRWGKQAMLFGEAQVWVLPNPSGLNRAFTLEGLITAYRELSEVVKL